MLLKLFLAFTIIPIFEIYLLIKVGTVFGALVIGVSRNPSLKDELFKLAILGFALTEAIALFSLMMAFLILFAL